MSFCAVLPPSRACVSWPFPPRSPSSRSRHPRWPVGSGSWHRPATSRAAGDGSPFRLRHTMARAWQNSPGTAVVHVGVERASPLFDGLERGLPSMALTLSRHIPPRHWYRLGQPTYLFSCDRRPRCRKRSAGVSPIHPDPADSCPADACSWPAAARWSTSRRPRPDRNRTLQSGHSAPTTGYHHVPASPGGSAKRWATCRSPFEVTRGT